MNKLLALLSLILTVGFSSRPLEYKDLVFVEDAPMATIKAFPTAYGGGATTVGGRGGIVVLVNTLNYNAPLTFVPANGSLEAHYTGGIKAAIEDDSFGARYIIFDVAGVCVGDVPDTYDRDDPNFVNRYTDGIYTEYMTNQTILGQTAPEGGFALTKSKIYYNRGSQLILRHLKVRPHLLLGSGQPIGDDVATTPINIGNANVIVDHCSLSHGGDKGLIMGNFASNAPLINMTAQNNMILNSKTLGFSVNDQNGANEYNLQQNISWFYNLMMSSHRHPNIGGGNNYFEAQNNVNQMNGVSEGRWTRIYYASPKFNHVNNYFDIVGSSTIKKNVAQEIGGNKPLIHTRGNYFRSDAGVILDGTESTNNEILWGQFGTPQPQTPLDGSFFSSTSFYGQIPNPAPLLSAINAKTQVLDDAGANKSITDNGTIIDSRDSYDALAVSNFNNRIAFNLNWTGFSMPSQTTRTRPVNYYQTVIGIPEWFVQEHGITDKDEVKINYVFENGIYPNEEGYPAIEVYANWIAGDLDDYLVQQTYTSRLAAFPTAIGPNVENITGGRNGPLCIVNTTSTASTGSYDASTNSYSGSLTYLLDLDIPSKYIIFKVAGLWNYTGQFDLYYGGTSYSSGNGGNVTLNGSTAPYPGVFLYGSSFAMTDPDCTNWIMRGITIMQGSGIEPGSSDGIYFGTANDNVIVANVTSMWSPDENITMNGQNSTQQYNLMLEGYRNHNKGGIIGPQRDDVLDHDFRMAGHNSVAIHVQNRLFNTGGSENDQFDMWNNAGYNFSDRIISVIGDPKFNYINNYFKTYRDDTIYIRWNACYTNPSVTTGACYRIAGVDVPSSKFYWKGNKVIDNDGSTIHYHNPSGFDNSGSITGHHISFNGYTANDPLPSSFFTDTQWPLIDSNAVILTADETYTTNVVGKKAGSLWYTDSNGNYQKHIEPFVDAYYDDFINGTISAWMDSIDTFPAPSVSASGTAFTDSDKDGIADVWEDANGLDSNDHTDGMDIDNFTIGGALWVNPGYPNREVYHNLRDIIEGAAIEVVPDIDVDIIIKRKTGGAHIMN